MSFTAKDVMTLRQRTGAGMMDCKKALNETNGDMDKAVDYLREKGICSVFHYVPLHSAPAGQKFGRFSGEDVYTTRESERLLRLPLFYNLDMEDVKYITDTIASFDGF